MIPPFNMSQFMYQFLSIQTNQVHLFPVYLHESFHCSYKDSAPSGRSH